MTHRRGRDRWSATGAARAARECKACEISFLDQAPTAVRLQANAMETSYRALLRLYHDPQEAACRVLFALFALLRVAIRDDVPGGAPEVIVVFDGEHGAATRQQDPRRVQGKPSR